MKTLTKTLILFTFLMVCITSDAQITYEPAFSNLNFEYPVELQSPLDETDRMFVVEEPGRIKVFPRDPNVTAAEVSTFLKITSIVNYGVGQEIGLLGLAFHPDYATNGYFYVYYTASSPVLGIISLFCGSKQS